MSTQPELIRREAEEVVIGSLTMYCEGFKASGTIVWSEQTTVSGDAVFTNRSRRALRLTFTGRCYEPEQPLLFMAEADGIRAVTGTYTIHYRGAVFTDCHIQSYTAEDKGDGIILTTVTLLTTEPVELEED